MFSLLKPASQQPRTCRATAYRCFNYISLFFVSVAILALLPLDHASYQVVGMVVGIPATLMLVAAGAVAVLSSLICARERPLLIMSGCFVALCVLFVIGEGVPAAKNYTLLLNVLSLTAIITIIFFCARHYLQSRHGQGGSGSAD